MTKIITNGCSLTFGAEIIGKNDYTLENKKYSWPSILGKKLNAEVENLAVCASSNLSIYRSTMNKLLSLTDTNVWLIIQWSGYARTEIKLDNCIIKELTEYKNKNNNIDIDSFVRDNKYTNLTNGFKTSCVEKYENLFWLYQADEEYQKELLKSYIVSIFLLSEKKNIACTMFNGLEPLNFQLPTDIANHNFIDPDTFVFYDKKGKTSAHPPLEDHERLADFLYHRNPF